MKLIESLAEYDGQKCRYQETYVKEEQLLIEFDRSCFRVTDIRNGMNPRKRCDTWTIFYEARMWAPECELYVDVLNGYDHDFSAFIKALITEGEKALEKVKNNERYELHVGDCKSAYILNPWKKINKQDFSKRITAMKIIKGILNGQIKKAVQLYYYSDDYKYDAEQNFGENVEMDLLNLAENLNRCPDMYSKWVDSNGDIVLYENFQSIRLKLA